MRNLLELMSSSEGMEETRSITKPTKQQEQQRKRKVKRGIFGFPKGAKRNRILFFTRDLGSSESDSDDCLDPDFAPLGEDSDQEQSPPSRPRRDKTEKRDQRRERRQVVNSNASSAIVSSSSSSNWSNGVPYELLYKIFEYYSHGLGGDVRQLDHLKAVCKYWSRVADDPKLWCHLDVSKLFPAMYICEMSVQTKKAFPNSNYDKFMRRLRVFVSRAGAKLEHVRRIGLNNLAYLDCEGLEIVLGKCSPTLIREINLSNCPRLHHVSAKNDTFEAILSRSCPNLTSLYLDKIDKQITYKGIFKLLEVVGPNLKILSLAKNQLSHKILNSIGDNCPHIEELDISESVLMGTGTADFDYLSEKCSQLKRLYMHDCQFRFKYTSIESVLASPVAFVSLEQFSLADKSPFYGDSRILNMMLKLSKDSENLKTLHLIPYKCPLDSYTNYFTFFKTNRLAKLNMPNSFLSEADNTFLAEAIVSKWSTSLVELNLSFSSISLQTIETIFDGFVRKSNECALKSLDLSGTCVTTELIMKLVRNLSTLKTINLNSCRSIQRGLKRVLTESDIQKLAKS